MKFTWSDLATFGIGLGAAVAWEIGSSLVDSKAIFEDTTAWIQSLAIGTMTATGRWVLTYLTLRGFKPG